MLTYSSSSCHTPWTVCGTCGAHTVDSIDRSCPSAAPIPAGRDHRGVVNVSLRARDREKLEQQRRYTIPKRAWEGGNWGETKRKRALEAHAGHRQHLHRGALLHLLSL